MIVVQYDYHWSMLCQPCNSTQKSRSYEGAGSSYNHEHYAHIQFDFSTSQETLVMHKT